MSRQDEVLAWTVATFGEKSLDPRERAFRLLEEACETAQAVGLRTEEMTRVVRSVMARPVGVVEEELAGTQICLTAMAGSLGVNLATITREEWVRIQTRERSRWVKTVARKRDLGISTIAVGDLPPITRATS